MLATASMDAMVADSIFGSFLSVYCMVQNFSFDGTSGDSFRTIRSVRCFILSSG